MFDYSIAISIIWNKGDNPSVLEFIATGRTAEEARSSLDETKESDLLTCLTRKGLCEYPGKLVCLQKLKYDSRFVDHKDNEVVGRPFHPLDLTMDMLVKLEDETREVHNCFLGTWVFDDCFISDMVQLLKKKNKRRKKK